MLVAAQRLLDAVSRAMLAFSNVLLVVLFLLINAEIVLRATLGKSTLVSDEYSGYLLCWLTLSSLLYGMRTNAFLRVEIVVHRLRGRMRSLAEALAATGGLVVSLVACYSTGLLALTNWKFHGTSTHFTATPLYLPQSMMPAAFALLAVAYLVQLAVVLGQPPVEPHDGGA